MKKQFLRVKQIADQTFLRAEKTDVLTEDLVTAEKRIDTIRLSCQTTQKKISSCNIDFGSETSSEKRLRKIPQIALGAAMLENGNNFSKCSVLGETLRDCSTVQARLGNELLEYYNEVEKTVLKPISSVLDNDVHNINKLRKQVGKLVLDMDSARARFQTAERHSSQTSSNASVNTLGKIDSLKDELEEASQKVEQCRDSLATEMFTLISKEPQLAQLFVHFNRLQADYHRNSLAALEAFIPLLEQQICDFPLKPLYGCPLDEHLRVTNREIALVVELCVSFLLEYGIIEEGLLRVAGSTSKVKKLKSAFDAGIDIDMTEFVRDPHAVSGALKSYLRELPEPLMTFSLYEEWVTAVQIVDFDTKLQTLWQVLHKLPDANFKNLQYVIKFLSKLFENVDVNKMSSQNIAIVMAPNLIWSSSEDPSKMNMATASLHTSVVDTLISYADWFFPDADVLPSIKPSNLNDVDTTVILTESQNSDVEINGNNLQISSSERDTNSCSPRPLHRNIKKPAAPPPPAQRSEDCDKSEIATDEELIDFSGDSLDSLEKTCDNLTVTKPEQLDALSVKDLVRDFESSPNQLSPAIVLPRRKSNENFSSNELTNKSEKPVVSDKPNAYSSCSLDRRSHRQSQFRGDKISESMVRSHIERPTVPPPERPVKPPKFCSSELGNSPLKGNSQEDSGQKSSPTSPDKSINDTQEDETIVPMANVSKPDHNPPVLHRSRSATKVNRFDFLVNQTNDKPPERPPRTHGDHSERTASTTSIPETAETDLSETVPSSNLGKVPNLPSPDSSPPPVTTLPPLSPRIERDKKPPRPQPPVVPAKPKFNVSSENTSL